MARHNHVSLLGVVQKKPAIEVDADGNYLRGIAFLRVTRGSRSVGDKRLVPKYDSPCIWTRDPEIVKKMSEWNLGDVVSVKGTVTTKSIMKGSVCSHCNQRNKNEGVLVYINPIHVLTVAHFDSDEDQIKYLQENSEISNEVQVIGTLVRDPKKITPKVGLIVTQYQIALNRKFRIAADPPETKTDFPWVKAYGDNAISDREHLHTGSEIYVDGCIQSRRVNRHSTCAFCGEVYDWQDNAMEIVPFSTEYLTDYYTDEDIAAREAEETKKIEDSIFGKRIGTPGEEALPDDEITQDDIDAGMDIAAKPSRFGDMLGLMKSEQTTNTAE